jgi:pSer/pThr/pTyr-binding forkhead associated (FHA) protein/tetratricopeptide (TPR) repeat protein
MPPRRPTSSRANSSSASGGASANDRTELKPSPYARRGGRPAPPPVEDLDAEPSMENPVEEDYHTSNHFPGEEEEEGPGEGTPVGEDPRVVSKEFVSLEDEEEEDGPPEPEEDDDNPDATRAGPPVSLVIVEGPDKGKKRRFKSVRMVLGRAKGVDFRLNDQSVSRRHLELVHGDTGTVLRDLVSASGTRVNDERVDECTLKHGDVISLGKTSIRYVDELEQVKQLRAEQEAREAEAKKAEEEAKRKKEEEAAAKKAANANASAVKKADVDPNDPRFNEATNARFVAPDSLRDVPTRRSTGKKDTKVLVFGGLGVALVAFIVVVIIVMSNQEPPPPPPPDPKEALAIAKMQGARTAIREGNFAEAVQLIEEAEALKPGIDADKQADAARNELAVVEALAEVRGLMEQQRFEEARQKLDTAPEGITAKSDDERKALDKQLIDAEGAYYTQKVEDLLANRDVAGARALVDKLPANARPLYRQKADELEAQLTLEVEEAEDLDRTNKVLAAKRAAAKRAQMIAEAFDVVERKFDNGDYERAVLECDRVVDVHKGDNEIRERARNLKRLIPQFARTYQDAQRKIQAGSMETAVRPLRKAEEIYRQLGFTGPMLDAIREQLAESSVRAGKAALARRDIASAGQHFREALRLSPGEPRAQEGLNSLQEEAENLYQRAYIERDRDPRSAAEKFRIVIDTAPEGSELRRKAQMYLQELQP